MGTFQLALIVKDCWVMLLVSIQIALECSKYLLAICDLRGKLGMAPPHMHNRPQDLYVSMPATTVFWYRVSLRTPKN